MVEPGVVGGSPVLLAAITGERDETDAVATDCSNATSELEAVHAGKAQIDQSHLGTVLHDRAKATGAVAGRLDFVAIERQQRFERVPDVGVVLDESNGQ